MNLLVTGCRAGLVLVFTYPAGLGFRSFPLQCAADPFFVGLLPRSSVRIGGTVCASLAISYRAHTTGRSFDRLS
jgi:hypothetical protein